MLAAELAKLNPVGTFAPPTSLGQDGQFYVVRLQGAGLMEGVVLSASPPRSRAGLGYRTDTAIEFQFTPTFRRLLKLLGAGGMDLTKSSG
jgi:hypothetical protein